MLSDSVVPVYIVTDCFNNLDKETFEKKYFSVKFLYKYRKELSLNSDVTFNPENKNQLIAVSRGRLISVTLLSKDYSWDSIDDCIEY
jgi:hypothetical protein